MSLRDTEQAVEISPGFREIVVSECKNYMAFLFVNSKPDGTITSKIEVWMTGEFNFLDQEIYKIQEFELEGFSSILDFGFWINHSQAMFVGRGSRRVNGKLHYETVELYSVNDGKLQCELPGVMMGMQGFVKNNKGDYLTSLFSDTGDDVALMIVRAFDIN